MLPGFAMRDGRPDGKGPSMPGLIGRAERGYKSQGSVLKAFCRHKCE